jgi:adenylosuccinate lyase
LIRKQLIEPCGVFNNLTLWCKSENYEGENEVKINEDLENNWAVVAEAIQTILRREQYPNPYEALKDLTRGNSKIDKKSMHKFIDGLKVTVALKKELKKITPQNYTGVTAEY